MRVLGSPWASVRAAALVLALLASALLIGLAPGARGQDGAEDPARPAHAGGDPAPTPGAGLRGGDRVSHEAVGLRSAESRTYVLDDGRMLTKVFGSPVNFPDGDGGWRAIDTSLEADGKGGYGIAQAPFDLSLPGSLGDGAAVRVARGGHVLSFELARARPSAAEVEGAQATYRAVLPGVDIQYVARASGVKESLMLAGAAAAGDLDFKLGSGDLTPGLTKFGGVELRGADGRSVFSIAAPFMRDAAGQALARRGLRAAAGRCRLDARRAPGPGLAREPGPAVPGRGRSDGVSGSPGRLSP